MLVSYFEWIPFRSNAIFEVSNDNKDNGAAQLHRLFASRLKAHQFVFLVCSYFSLQKEDMHSSIYKENIFNVKEVLISEAILKSANTYR